ncbi:putative Peptidase S24/S26A/S26B/S26C [Vibrio nigripulchritudo SFn27]|uniref:Putative Peptidase S24/S26A/S26B/S26C n=1 Tax=Vibrio nigripulchritudo TaxID=28173 RepID=U4K554_9VIBR|nr:S24 family peptidase [Vibrio nigripulchritudo]CCN38195.1 putative Peptidase S24/S26A/S26B/S26C [Vibrio nigripulchritudo AM115]CCN42673.1 putative Peptidase S24/S26A/S26B/S26C [Vibrio nigripulchritudo FTn2]CCN79069.1 putative Peptidase S24/S26A/S26B/S26C [Vibrio nigripulchritudo SO65]CCN84351.1 putative Peptidase S24/S26A/S26B/S26C [Vibrio nigripulchritudo BLFn1]CCN87140.1 putative Peptidase S24/S26A/S26B/S26C [Vibrio nigripulchritudo SFn27]
MSISKRITQRMSDLGLKGVDITNATGVSSGGVSQWVNGVTKPGGSNLLSLAKLLQCEPEWLLNGKGISPSVVATVESGPDITGLFPLLRWEDTVSWVTTSHELDSQNLKRYPCPAPCSEKTFILQVKGISMEPDIRAGELIFVDPEVSPSNDMFVVVSREAGNKVSLKQLIIEDGKQFLKSSNPNWPEQIIPLDPNDSILGVVIFAGTFFS